MKKNVLGIILKSIFVGVLLLWVGIYSVLADIVQVGSEQTAYVADQARLTVDIPAGTTIGDVLIINVVYGGNGGTAIPHIENYPDDWTVISSALSGDDTYRGTIFYKVVTNSWEDKYTIALSYYPLVSNAEASIVAFRGVDPSNPIDAIGNFTTTTSVSGSTINPAGITTVTPNALVVMLGMSYRSYKDAARNFSSWSASSPANLVELYQYKGGNRVSVGAASAIKVTPGSTGDGTITLSGKNTYRGGIMMALRPYVPVTSPGCTMPVSPTSNETGVAAVASLNWDAAPNATGYYLYFGTNASANNIENGTDLGNVTSYTPLLNLDFLTDYYWKIVPYNIYGEASGCSTWSFTTADISYCVTNIQTTSRRTITNVSFNTIDNPSGYPNAGVYTDYTTLSTDVDKNQQYRLSVSIQITNNSSGYVNAWFDWNSDGDFEDSGEYYSLGNESGTGTYTKTLDITIPGSSTVGSTRFRIGIYSTGNTDPCGDGSTRGEVEDYTINIMLPVTISTETISQSDICPGSAVSVPYTISGTFNSGNVFTAQLSNASGSFASPVTIGTVALQSSGTISATIPSGQASGSGYRIRVVSSDPVVIGSDNGSDISIGAPEITGTAPGAICGSGSVTISATASAGTINWYSSLTGGSSLGTGNTYMTPDLTTSTTYYVDATNGSCTSSPRVAIQAAVITPPSITASGGGTFCNGSTVNLTSSSTDITNQYWTGPNSFYSLSQNVTLNNVTTADAGTYTVIGSALSGVNLVTNGNFENGNTGFTTNYILSDHSSSGLYPESTYDVIALPSSEHDNFCTCGDHTSGSGLQMVINGAGTETTIWSQTVNVVQNTDYQFTYWVQTVVNGNDSNPSKIQLYVNGSNAGPVYSANPTTGVWTQFTYNWNSGSGTSSATLELKNENFAAGGNDFALDDIVFQQACTATVSVDVAVASSFTPSVVISASSNPVCSGSSVTFTATPTDGGTTPTYQWKKNGINVGGNSNTYVDAVLQNNDQVSCTMTSDLACASPSTVSSNVITMTVNPDNTISLTSATGSDNQTVCVNSAINDITYNTTGATGATFSGLPTGVSGSWAGGVVTLSGTPTESGTFGYTVTLAGGCGTINASGTITVGPDNTIILTSAIGTDNQTVCQNSAITDITYNTTGATGATFSGLPTGVSGSWAGAVVTISGIPTESGTFGYTVNLTGGCGSANALGTITIQPASVGGTATATNSQVCFNTGTTISLSGYTGSIQWQQSADGSTGWANVTGGSGANSATYTTPNLTTATWYRTEVTSGICSNAYSNTVAVGIDNVPPTFSGCPSNITQNVDAGACSALVTWTIPVATDNCGGTPTVVRSSSAGVTFVDANHATVAVGTSTITYTATDAAGNPASCSFNITVNDNIFPTINCPSGGTVFCVGNAPSYITYTDFINAGGSAGDNCNLNTSSFTKLADNIVGSTLTRTYQISDAAGNTSSCSQVFTISQPTLTISSLGLDNTCPGGALTITSDATGSVHYQWQLSTDNGSNWSNIGTDNASYSGTLASLGDQYRLWVSESMDFSQSACNTVSNVLTFVDVTSPVFTLLAPANQTVCTANGSTNAAVYSISLDNSKVTDNCTAFRSLTVSYSISGVTTGSGTGSLAEGMLFNLGTSTVEYTVTDLSGNSQTHSFTVTVNEDPAISTITTDGLPATDGSGYRPNQGSTHSYDVTNESGYTYTWSTNPSGATLTGQGTASANITWGAGTMPGNYVITVIKDNNSTHCQGTQTLDVTVLNVFNPKVQDFGNSCHDVSGATTIDWVVYTDPNTVTAPSWSFTWNIYLIGNPTPLNTGTETVTSPNSKTISYTVFVGDGSEKNYHFEISGVTDSLGNPETNTTDNSDDVKIFAKPTIGF